MTIQQLDKFQVVKHVAEPLIREWAKEQVAIDGDGVGVFEILCDLADEITKEVDESLVPSHILRDRRTPTTGASKETKDGYAVISAAVRFSPPEENTDYDELKQMVLEDYEEGNTEVLDRQVAYAIVVDRVNIVDGKKVLAG